MPLGAIARRQAISWRRAAAQLLRRPSSRLLAAGARYREGRGAAARRTRKQSAACPWMRERGHVSSRLSPLGHETAFSTKALAPIADPKVVPGRNLQGRSLDRKSTRLNSSHTVISYAVFCLKKKKNTKTTYPSSKKKKKTK